MSRILSHRIVPQCGRLLVLIAIVAFAANVSAADDGPQYNRDIRPLLSKHCFTCHGLDSASREADLRLDVRASAIDARVLSPGQPDESEVVFRIESDDPDLVMPPADSGHQLTDEEITLLRRWVAEGAEYQQHWSFISPRKSELPSTDGADWPAHEIDHFVLKRLEDAGLRPSPPADRLRLLRRLSLDLTGLPPTMEEADAFLADESDQALEDVVDRLLASEAFGEHWARMWLDLARYADTKGYEKDRHRDIWRYRDWVIDAFNQDMPFDQFTYEQLGGDLLPESSDDQILATAFHRNTMTNDEGGTDNEEFRVAAVKDRVDTTVQVWMGLTMGCAKCHTHKYDPISIDDYYSLFAFFNQTRDADNEAPFHPTPTTDQAHQIAELKAELRRMRAEWQHRPDGFAADLSGWRSQFEQRPLWQTLALAEFTSEHEVDLVQNEEGNIIARGTRPERDTWTLTFELPTATDGVSYTSLRIDYFPLASAGGEWADRNVAIRELTAELVQADGSTRQLKLKNPRATYSQPSWSIAAALDGNPNVGWGLSPRFNERQAGLFDLEEPISEGKLRLTLEQQYGEGLLLARSRFSLSSHPSEWLRAELEPDLERTFAESVHPETSTQFRSIDAASQSLRAIENGIPKTPVMVELDENARRVTRVHNRGNFLDQGEQVSPAVPTVFGEFPADAPANRLGVAHWLMQPTNPLTVRVMVNRIWARLFGVGIVETEEDFGSQGLPPSHPELLDWLAVDFRERDWSIKQLLKTIVMSRTYRQSSVVTPEILAADPRNRLFSRGPRVRLSAEAVRDQALAVSGLLTRQVGGPSVMPPQPGGVWKSTYSGEKWKNATGPDRYRRAVYTYLKRTSPYPALNTFDAGSGEVCQIRRVQTNTPLQALVTLNDTAFMEAAGALAVRMASAGGGLRDQIEIGFRMVLVRQPADQEIDRLMALYESLGTEALDRDALLESAGLKDGDPRLVVLANVLLNLDETLMK